MKYVIRIYALEGTTGPGGPVWGYVRFFDPDAHGGRGNLVTTADPARARQFDSAIEAGNFWRQQSKVRPLRPDGKPNRPLTAYSVVIEQVGKTVIA